MKYILFLITLLIFSPAYAVENTADTVNAAIESSTEPNTSANTTPEKETPLSEEAVPQNEDKREITTSQIESPILKKDIFSQQFVKALNKCQPAIAQNPQDATDAPLIIAGTEESSCHLKYGDFNLFLPQDILPNLHGFDDLQILLRNREIAHLEYQPKYVYTGLLHALNSCRRGTDYLGVEKTEEKGNIHTKNSLEAEYFQDICTIYLISELEIEGSVTDYTVVCKIGANAVIGLLDYYKELLEKYGEKRTEVNGKPVIVSEKENEETYQADSELMFFLQQKGYCQRPNDN